MMSGPGSSQAHSSSEMERKACDVIHLLLVWEQKKIPIKRADITKYVMKVTKLYVVKDHRSSFAEVMKIVDKKLKTVFGLQLIEIGEASRKAFMLVSLLESAEAIDMMEWKGNSKRGLLFTVLALIFMSGETMSDGPLWNALKGLGIEKDRNHSVFGDVKKILNQEFARQMYLDVTKIPNCDPPQFEYKWGPRTYHEITKRQVLKFVTKLYDKTDITIWKSRYQSVIDDEAERQAD